MSTPVRVTPDLLRGMALPQPGEGGKDERGRVFIVAGSVEIAGAALLAGISAFRAGAGRVQIATVESCARHLGFALPEARVLGVPETPAGGMAREGADKLLAYVKRCDAILIGPGMMGEEESQALAEALLCETDTAAIVLDAAALPNPETQAEALKRYRGRLVITPHAGEMAHLLGREKAEIEADPLGAARAAAALLGAVVIMKGACTHIVSPQGQAWLFDGGHVGLAVSGSGDTLAGFLVALLARGASPIQAALWAVHLHGEAGSRLARSCGPLGFLAREIPGEAPRLLAELAPPS
jgi:ADP-dependent NAD(P)H-hydrate dehydratase